MAFYILHDSFIRPAPRSHPVLTTSNRDHCNLTKTEKRKFRIYEKENVPEKTVRKKKQTTNNDADENIGTTKQSLDHRIQYSSEDTFDIFVDECTDFSYEDFEILYTNVEYVKENVASHNEYISQVMNFPQEKIEHFHEEKCGKLVQKGNKKFTKKNLTVSIVNIELNTPSAHQSEVIESVGDLTVQNVYRHDNAIQKTVTDDMNDYDIDEVILKFASDTDLSGGTVDSNNNNNYNIIAVTDYEKENLMKDSTHFIFNDITEQNEISDQKSLINQDDDSADDELPSLEYVDRIMMTREPVKRNADQSLSDGNILDKITSLNTNLEECSDYNKSYDLKPCHFAKKQVNKTRSRFMSPKNRKERTIEREYQVYKDVLKTGKLHDTILNRPERQDNRFYDTTEVNLKENTEITSASCISSGENMKILCDENDV